MIEDTRPRWRKILGIKRRGDIVVEKIRIVIIPASSFCDWVYKFYCRKCGRRARLRREWEIDIGRTKELRELGVICSCGEYEKSSTGGYFSDLKSSLTKFKVVEK